MAFDDFGIDFVLENPVAAPRTNVCEAFFQWLRFTRTFHRIDSIQT